MCFKYKAFNCNFINMVITKFFFADFASQGHIVDSRVEALALGLALSHP